MSWVAPDVLRPDEPFVAPERAILQGFLDYGRRTVLVKCSGLTAEHLTLRAVPPSTLSLLGLVRHLTDVERTWFRRRFAGQDIEPVYYRPDREDAAFGETDPARVAEDIEALQAEWVAADAAVSALPLEHVFLSPRWGEMSLRWCYQHVISDYTRHNGQADLLRERIDGRTGV